MRFHGCRLTGLRGGGIAVGLSFVEEVLIHTQLLATDILDLLAGLSVHFLAKIDQLLR